MEKSDYYKPNSTVISSNLAVLRQGTNQNDQLLQLIDIYGVRQISHRELQLHTSSDNYEPLLLLNCFNGKLGLQLQGVRSVAPITIDFGELLHKQRNVKHKLSTELLIKAANLNKKPQQTLLDATAGFAVDSSLLMAAGAQVTLCDCHPIIGAMLIDAYERNNIPKNIQIVPSNALNLLESNTNFDVIYLDPMFPSKTKSALAKKEMQVMQKLHQYFPVPFRTAELFEKAIAHAGNRVVVKRPLKADYINDKQPDYSLKGKVVRFDIYLT